MKKNVFLAMLLLVFCLALLTGCGGDKGPDNIQETTEGDAAPVAELPTLIAGADITYPPFEYMEGSTAVGFDVDLWQEIGKRIGRKTEHANYSWDGLIPGLMANKFDVIMSCMSVNEERLKQIDFSIPYFIATYGIAVTNESNIKGLEDLKGKIVGAQTGTGQEIWTREHQQELGIKEIVPYEIMNDCLLDLEAGRIDAAINEKPYLAYTLKDNKKVTFLSDVTFGNTLNPAIGITKDNSELKGQIDQAIRDIIKDGTWAKIYEKWFGFAPAEQDIPQV